MWNLVYIEIYCFTILIMFVFRKRGLAEFNAQCAMRNTHSEVEPISRKKRRRLKMTDSPSTSTITTGDFEVLGSFHRS